MYGAKLTSVWGKSLTTTFTGSYNTKGGNDLDSYQGRDYSGPLTEYHQFATANQGRLTGSGLLVTWRQLGVDRLRHLLRPRHVDDHDASRRHDLVQAGLDGEPRLPDRLPRHAAQQLRQERASI